MDVKITAEEMECVWRTAMNDILFHLKQIGHGSVHVTVAGAALLVSHFQLGATAFVIASLEATEGIEDIRVRAIRTGCKRWLRTRFLQRRVTDDGMEHEGLTH